MSGYFTNGIVAGTSANNGLPLTGSETYPVDTNKANGVQPETMALTGYTMSCIGIGPQTALGTVASGTITVDCTTGSFFSVTIGGTGMTLNLVNPSPGQNIEVEVVQGSGGSKTITTYQTKVTVNGVTTTVAVKWPTSAPTLTSSAAAIDLLKFRYGGAGGAAVTVANMYASGSSSLNLT